jgi:hypothetical protein
MGAKIKARKEEIKATVKAGQEKIEASRGGRGHGGAL